MRAMGEERRKKSGNEGSFVPVRQNCFVTVWLVTVVNSDLSDRCYAVLPERRTCALHRHLDLLHQRVGAKNTKKEPTPPYSLDSSRSGYFTNIR